MVPPTFTDTSKVTGSPTSSPAAGCGLTSVMVAICHFEADWQSPGSVSRQKANTGMNLRDIQAPLCSFPVPDQSPRAIRPSQELFSLQFLGRNRHANHRWGKLALREFVFHVFARHPVGALDTQTKLAPTSGHPCLTLGTR